MRIALDAGHGYNARGQPTGARGHGIIEDEWALQFVGRLGHYLRAAGAQTVLTRPTTAIVGLQERGRIAKRERCDVFLSVHLNAASSASAHGAEIYVAARDVKPKSLAVNILAVIANAGIANRGVKWDSQSQHSSLTVLRTTCNTMKSLLLEVGFLSNREDAALLRDRRWCENLAAGIAQAIIRNG